jgi:hypothetical protein
MKTIRQGEVTMFIHFRENVTNLQIAVSSLRGHKLFIIL